jgi:LPS-assembly protein
MAPIQNFPTHKWPSRFFRSRLAFAIAAQCAGAIFSLAPAAYAQGAEVVAEKAAPVKKDPQQQLREMDWVPMEELTPEQRASVPTACCGAYIAPLRTDDDADADPEGSNIFGTADYSESEQQTRFIMRDNVRLTQGRRSFNADVFSFDQVTREAQLDGDIQVREPGLLLRADSAYVDTQSGDARLENARFVLYESRVRGRAERLQRFGEQIISLDQGTFTSCEPGDNTWLIEGSNITLHNDKHYGTARHMRLKVKDVPIAYAPYFRFPIGPDRLTGFLFPSVGIDSDTGMLDDISVPFYWNIAPNYDATFTPRYLADHGYLLYSEFRHKSAYFDTELSGSSLANDRGGYSKRLESQIEAGEISEAEAYPYKGLDRWQYNLKQTGGRNQRWSTSLDYTEVSDTDYIRDIDRGEVDLNRQAYIRQSFAADYRMKNWKFGGKIEEFQRLTNRQLPYRELPRLKADGLYRFNNWVLDLDNEYVNFSMNRHYRDDPRNASRLGNLIVGERVRTNYNLYWDKQYTAGYIKPGVGVKTLSYRLDADNMRADVDTEQQFAAPQATLDMGLFFERDKTLFANDFTQTLEPRAYYVYRDYEDQTSLYGLTTPTSYVNFDTSDIVFTYNQLFRDTRFSGGDRIDDANNLTLGVTSRFVDTNSGIERLRMSIGQVTYFDDRRVSILNKPDDYDNTRTTSAIAGELRAQIGEHLRWTNNALYDHQREKINAFSSSLHYMDEQYRILNVGYRYTRDPVTLNPLDVNKAIGPTLNQIDVTTLWPINNQWSFIARANYDFTHDAELDTFAGLEYTDCCYKVRVLGRQWVNFDLSENFLEKINNDDYDRGIFVEVELRGFGNLSNRISKLLDKAMYGYSEREASFTIKQ